MVSYYHQQHIFASVFIWSFCKISEPKLIFYSFQLSYLLSLHAVISVLSLPLALLPSNVVLSEPLINKMIQLAVYLTSWISKNYVDIAHLLIKWVSTTAVPRSNLGVRGVESNGGQSLGSHFSFNFMPQILLPFHMIYILSFLIHSFHLHKA